MKKTMILAAFAALISLASCQKEEVIDNGTDKNASPVFTASIAGATKTTIDLTAGKVAWEEADEITVTDAAKNSATYTIESIDATTGKATFVIKSGETALGDGPYTATYGTEPATVQFYSETPGKLYMTAPETSSNSFTFTVQCGLMKLNLTSPDESVKSIAVTSSTDATYTLTCDPAQSIASSKDFFIALPAGSYKKIEITNSSDVKATLNSTNGVAVAANHIKPVTFGESKLTFTPAVPDGALSGVFSVSDTKKVYFSKGNLRATYTGSEYTWGFAENQYDFIGEYPGNTSIEDIDENSIVDLFGWSTDITNFGINTNSESDDCSGEFIDWGVAYCESNGIENEDSWYTLTIDEWDYLLNARIFKDGTDEYGGEGYSYKITYIVSDQGYKTGLILYPDNYTEQNNNSLGWTEMEKAGCVFLPLAGNRDGSDVFMGCGFYWSSSDYGDDTAYKVLFTDSDIYSLTDTPESRHYGFSVRLVTNVE